MFLLSNLTGSNKLISLLSAAGIISLAAIAPANSQGAYQPSGVQSKTYLINGLASAIPFIGFGMANLKKKIPGARLFSYVSPIEGTTVIQPLITREIRKLYKQNPNILINLIGISYGASMVTSISASLARDNIPVNYLGVVDGRPLTKIYPNVRRVDNFTCTFIDCIGARLRMASGNQSTQKVAFKFRSTHIALGNNTDLHTRVIQQISAYNSIASRRQTIPGVDNRTTAAIRAAQ
ncbi:MAG: hypothetical protein L3J32_06435 [Rhizobiaceae bacterium]|nr:hypothetical protein [Rhizobiaceae bacterium]